MAIKTLAKWYHQI